MFPRSASSLENPQENCLKSYWPALMQFLMKMPPIIRLTGAGCYQCPWCWVQWSMTSHESPDGHHTADHRELTWTDWALMSRNCNVATWVSKILTKEWRMDWLFEIVSAAMMILSSASAVEGVTPLQALRLCPLSHSLFTGPDPCSPITNVHQNSCSFWVNVRKVGSLYFIPTYGFKVL